MTGCSEAGFDADTWSDSDTYVPPGDIFFGLLLIAATSSLAENTVLFEEPFEYHNGGIPPGYWYEGNGTAAIQHGRPLIDVYNNGKGGVGTAWLSYADDNFNPVHHEGIMGFRTWNTKVWFDNFRVVKLHWTDRKPAERLLPGQK